MKLFEFDTDQQWDYENGFYLTSHITRLAKILAHYELYKSILDLPGEIVECGVYKGASLLRFATFREILESPYSRKIIGFDIFGKFPGLENTTDKKINLFEAAGGEGISVDELEKVFAHKSISNYELVQGNVCNTVYGYAVGHPEFKIALLHIDIDLYEPTMIILNNLYEKIVNGGVIMFDDFGTVSDETLAIDDFFRGKDVLIKKSPISHRPAYIRVGGK